MESWGTTEPPWQPGTETQQTRIENPYESPPTQPPFETTKTTTTTTIFPPPLNTTHCTSNYCPPAKWPDWRAYVDAKLAGGSNQTSLWVAFGFLAVCLVAVVLPMLVYLFLKLRLNPTIATKVASPAPLSDAFGAIPDDLGVEVRLPIQKSGKVKTRKAKRRMYGP